MHGSIVMFGVCLAIAITASLYFQSVSPLVFLFLPVVMVLAANGALFDKSFWRWVLNGARY